MNAPRGFKLNTQNARQVGASAQITEKGAYVGTFTRAEYVVSQKGTHGVEFDFKSRDGQSAKYLTVWTENAAGEDLGGRKLIDALMACMGIKEVVLKRCKAIKWDTATKAEVEVVIEGFSEFMGRPVGVVLHREEYAANTGERKWKNSLYCPFMADGNRLASERLDNKEAGGLAQILARLTDRPLKAVAQVQRRPAATSQQSGFGADDGGGFDDLDDDIPFITQSMRFDMEPSKARRLNRAAF